MADKFAIRIEHGEKKGIKISDGFFAKGSRITTSANRCVLFNVLRNKLHINFENKICADFCCGSGIIGFELLSLGCTKCIFADCDKRKLKNIEDAIQKTNFVGQTIYTYFPNFSTNERFDIIFFDPPYENDFCQSTIDMIVDQNLLNTESILIVETIQDLDTKKFIIADIKQLKNGAKFYFLKIKN